jgi:hypothetical protein
MNYTNLGLGNRLQELSTIEEEARASRLLAGAERTRAPNPVRVATGRAMVSLGSRLMGEPSPVQRPSPRRAAAAR